MEQLFNIPNGKIYKEPILIIDMVSIAKCTFCGKEFKDKHSERKGNKFCCREHFREYKKIHGCGNKGKTWEETYSPETLKMMKKRITIKGKEHWNYNRKRKDTLIRNLIKNPMKSKEEKEEIKKMFEENPEKTLNLLIRNMVPDKVYAYQRIAYEKYGRKCMICGQIKGQIDVHHKDRNRKNNKIENLQVLCAKCHAELHKNLIKERDRLMGMIKPRPTIM